MSITCLFIYTGRTALVKQFLKKVEETKHNEFINYFHIFYTANTDDHGCRIGVRSQVFQEMERVCNSTSRGQQEVQDPQHAEDHKSQLVKEIAIMKKCNERIDSIHDKLEVLLDAIKNISINDDS
nr:unnamed protein product [Callosobruchus analis]